VEAARFGLNTATLEGTLEEKLRATREAGFGAIEIWAKDLVGHPGGVAAAAHTLRSSELRLAGFELLRDYEGLSGHLHDYKLEIAKSLIELMSAVGARLLVVVSSTSPNAAGDLDRMADDLRTLGTLATPNGIRIGYEALAWGRFVNEYTDAWEVVRRAGRENVGLVIDAFHILARDTPLQHLDRIPGEKIFLVQLSDYLWELDDLIDTARHRRVFPSEGNHGLKVAELARHVAATGYRGDWTFEVFNDDYLHMPAAKVAARARQATQWMIEQVARQAVRVSKP
jgi:2-keto-myo-inositol isomerase